MAAPRRPVPASSHRVTLARALSKLGVLSRSLARAAIAAGRVAVDGRICRDPDRWVDPDRGIALDGEPARRRAPAAFAFHKPVDVVTTRADERGRRTIYDLLPADLPWLFPVGRLDRDSSGLLVLTNDTGLGAALTGSALAKVYDVTFDRAVSDAELAPFRAGMRLPDRTELRPVRARPVPGAGGRRVIMELREGRNRQIRRMAAAIGRTVVRLHRIAVGPVELGELAAGQLRPLTAHEREALREAVRQWRRGGGGGAGNGRPRRSKRARAA
ncbi:MAG TPA: pseudouridine synthase [Planctomycetota bacterium]|nr:pseudouridine synthase [Planctomycetota bacterium]